MKTIAKVNLILSIIGVCIGTTMLVLSAITTAKSSKEKMDIL